MLKLLIPAIGLLLFSGVDAERLAPPKAATSTAQPPGGPGGEMRKKMRERSRQACNGKADGATCSFETPRGKMAGHCRNRGEHGLMCVPKRQEERMKRAREACKGKSKGQTCTIEGPNPELEGKCAEGPAGLMCRPADARSPSK